MDVDPIGTLVTMDRWERKGHYRRSKLCIGGNKRGAPRVQYVFADWVTSNMEEGRGGIKTPTHTRLDSDSET